MMNLFQPGRALIILFLTLSINSSAKNYFVSSSSGNDAGSKAGTSPVSALKTVSKVNSMMFMPGDTVFFKRGDVWRETLIVSSSGTAGKNVVFSAYGTGERPEFLGSETTTWNDFGGNVWISDKVFTDPYKVGTYGAEIFFKNKDSSVSWGTHKVGLQDLTKEYDWTCRAGYIYVYSTIDPDEQFKSVEIPQRAFIISLNDKDYLHFRGLNMFYCGEAAVTYKTYPMQSQRGLIIEYCEIGYVSIKNSEAGYGIDATYNDQIVRHCEIHNCGRRSISHHLYGTFTATNILIEDNYFHDGFHTTGPDFSVGSSASSYYGSIDGVIVRRNLFYDSPTSKIYSHQIFIQNRLYSSLKAQVKNIYIYSNIFISPKGASINMEGSQSVFIYNNTFYNHSSSIPAAHIWIDNNNSSVKIKNNIFYSTSKNDAGGVELFVRAGQTAANVETDCNLYFRINSNFRIVEKEYSGTFSMGNFSQIHSAFGWEINSPAPADPLFFSPTDLHLSNNSPAVGKGTRVNIQDSPLDKDYDGKPFNNPPSIGALEFNGDYTTPLIPSKEKGKMILLLYPNPSR